MAEGLRPAPPPPRGGSAFVPFHSIPREPFPPGPHASPVRPHHATRPHASRPVPRRLGPPARPVPPGRPALALARLPGPRQHHPADEPAQVRQDHAPVRPAPPPGNRRHP